MARTGSPPSCHSSDGTQGAGVQAAPQSLPHSPPAGEIWLFSTAPSTQTPAAHKAALCWWAQ